MCFPSNDVVFCLVFNVNHFTTSGLLHDSCTPNSFSYHPLRSFYSFSNNFVIFSRPLYSASFHWFQNLYLWFVPPSFPIQYSSISPSCILLHISALLFFLIWKALNLFVYCFIHTFTISLSFVFLTTCLCSPSDIQLRMTLTSLFLPPLFISPF